MLQNDQRHEKHRSSCERGPRESSSVEERYHQHRADIVDDGQGGEEYFEPERHSRPEQCDHTERECDIGRHWYSPAWCPGAAHVQRCIDASRHEHPTKRTGNGKGGLPRRRKLADQHLTLDLEPHQKEEDSH